MLVSAERFDDMPVMSLQTGSELARTARAVIDPRDLSIAAYELSGRLLDAHPSLLMIRDMREIGPMGIIIDSVDEIVSPSDVVKLKEIYELGFELAGKSVVDTQGRKLGKVIGYTLEAGSFFIQQLRVHRPFFRSFGDTEVLIHRSQVTKVTDDQIVVKSAAVTHTMASTAQPHQRVQENPFRRASPETE